MTSYATPGSAGLDLVAKTGGVLKPGERALIPTTLDAPILKDNHSIYFLVVPRSGLALNHGITVLNSPGVIDMDYEGNVGVILYNTGVDDYEIKEGDRIGQLITMQMMRLTQFEVGKEERGDKGYGSTGA